jgi:hypothetical protein
MGDADIPPLSEYQPANVGPANVGPANVDHAKATVDMPLVERASNGPLLGQCHLPPWVDKSATDAD